MRQLTPPYILEQTQLGHTSGSLQAVCLFADTSGFTPLTTALMAHGTEGAEAIADTLTAIFRPLVQIIYQQGGFVAGFAGDAFKAIFPIDKPDAHPRAIAAAWQIRAYMRAHPQIETRYGTFTFAVKVTIADGQVAWGLWKGENSTQHKASFFEGQALDRCLEADAFANAGEIVLTQEVLDTIPQPLTTSDISAGHQQLTEVAATFLDQYPPNRVAIPQSESQGAAGFFPDVILNMRARGEFRQVVTAFINLQTLPNDTAFHAQLFRLLAQYGGYLCRIGRIGDRDAGGTLLFFWGAPVSRENDVERALGFLNALRNISPTPLKAGVTRSMAYAGFVGSDLREEYTVYGSHVNLAARQMVAADWGEIWLDENIGQNLPKGFLAEPMGAVQLKGFTEKLGIHTLVGSQEAGAQEFFRGRLIGREQELSRIGTAIAPIFSGQFAGVLTVRGEAGIGKSHLLYAAQQSIPLARWLICQTDEIIRQSLNPFRYWLRVYFDQRDTHSDAVNKARFEEKLGALIARTQDAAIGQELERTRPLLGALVNLFWEDSLYEHLDPAARFSNTLDAIKAVVRAEARLQPVVLYIEDAHWLDDDSRKLMGQLTRNMGGFPLVIVLSTRPEGDAIEFEEDVPKTMLAVEPLAPKDLSAMAEAIIGGRLTASFQDDLQIQSGGNPFFAEQILLYLQAGDLLTKTSAGEISPNSDAGALPNDVRAILVARIDTLTLTIKEVVQAAAILGREFEMMILGEMLRGQDIAPKVDAAERAAIWQALSELRYLFKHALLRDAAYEMQLRARRQELHRIAAQAFEIVYADDLSPQAESLAYHYRQAGDAALEKRYALLAAENAAQRYANADAVQFFTRALELTPKDDLNERFDILLKREQVLRFMTDRASQLRDITMLTKIAAKTGDPIQQSTALLQRAFYEDLTANYEQGAASAQDALRLLDKAGKKEDALLIYGKATGVWGSTLMNLGDIVQALEKIEASIELFKQVGSDADIPQAQRVRSLLLRRLGRNEEAIIAGKLALQGFRAINNRHGIARSYNTLGIVYLHMGQPKKSEKYYLRGLEIAETVGDKRAISWLLGNLGILYKNSSRYSNAFDVYARVTNLMLEVGDQQQLVTTKGNLGRLWFLLGQFEEAEKLYEESFGIIIRIKDVSNEVWMRNNFGMLARERNDYATAEQHLEQAIAIVADEKYGISSGYPHHNLGITKLDQEKWEAARDIFLINYEMRQTHGRPLLALSDSAGLAMAALELGKAGDALAHAQPIIDYLLDEPNFSNFEHPYRLVLAAYKVLTEQGDPRARPILKLGVDAIRYSASQIKDADLRDSFLANIKDNRTLLALWEN